MSQMTYLLDDNVSYKTLILYILKNIDNDVRILIYHNILMNEIIELENQNNWTELTNDNMYELDLCYSD